MQLTKYTVTGHLIEFPGKVVQTIGFTPPLDGISAQGMAREMVVAATRSGVWRAVSMDKQEQDDTPKTK